MPPLPQFTAFLEVPLCLMALGQYTGAHTVYTGRLASMRGHFHFLKNRLRPLFTHRDKAGFWKQHQLERR